MAGRSSSKPATYADIEALPPNMVGEIVRGVLYANPRPASPHAAAASAVGEELGPPFKRGKGAREVGASSTSPSFIFATHFGDAKVRAEPFEAVELELSVLWAR